MLFIGNRAPPQALPEALQRRRATAVATQRLERIDLVIPRPYSFCGTSLAAAPKISPKG
jgi:hypothetical protein